MSANTCCNKKYYKENLIKQNLLLRHGLKYLLKFIKKMLFLIIQRQYRYLHVLVYASYRFYVRFSLFLLMSRM